MTNLHMGTYLFTTPPAIDSFDAAMVSRVSSPVFADDLIDRLVATLRNDGTIDRSALRTWVDQTRTHGWLTPNADIDTLTDHFAAFLCGLFVRAKAGARPVELQQSMAIALNVFRD